MSFMHQGSDAKLSMKAFMKATQKSFSSTLRLLSMRMVKGKLFMFPKMPSFVMSLHAGIACTT